ncbi:Fe-S cluster assembly protein dre2 [Podospora conica]|nr:Fe-S cluster assembly protein dre2 [Schizothecium conicum]
MPITLDLTTSDFSPAPPPSGRTLLLAPPSLASSATRLPSLFTSGAFDRSTTDLHMLDRLAAGLITLPPATYDLVLVLAHDDGEPGTLDRALWTLLVPAVKPGGKVSAEDGRLSRYGLATPEAREAVLAGLVAGEDGFVKPEDEGEAVPIVFGLKRKSKAAAAENTAPPAPTPAPQPPKGVGFVDFSDDLDLDLDADDDGAELIDEETLLTEEDLRRPVPQPPECAPQPGKKRRACKDCTCGLAERLEAEDKQRRDKADKDLGALKLASADLNELDFTVKGKTGSCNSCYLGDAFRCAVSPTDCPYTGLPAFKPGEEVKILDNIAQF